MRTKIQKKNIVGLKELRENMEKYITRVNNGESIIVFRRSTPLFRLSPIDEDEGMWETIINFPKEIGHGVPIEELLESMRKMHGQKSEISQKTKR